MKADAFTVLHLIGATPHDFAGGTGNAPIHCSAFFANEKATQYIFGVVLGGLPLVAILVNIASVSFFSLYCEVVIKGDDSAKVF